MDIAIAPETPLQDDVRRLVAELNAFLQPQTPIAYQFQLTVEQMADPSLTLFVARDEGGNAIGMGGLKDHGDGLGEVKRMFTAARRARAACRRKTVTADRGAGPGQGHRARRAGNRWAPGSAEAYRVYERGGFSRLRRGARLSGFRLFAVLRKEDFDERPDQTDNCRSAEKTAGEGDQRRRVDRRLSGRDRRGQPHISMPTSSVTHDKARGMARRPTRRSRRARAGRWKAFRWHQGPLWHRGHPHPGVQPCAGRFQAAL